MWARVATMLLYAHLQNPSFALASTIRWSKGSGEIFCSSSLGAITGHLYEDRENYITGLVVIMWT